MMEKERQAHSEMAAKVTAIEPPTATIKGPTPAHCPYRQADLIQQALASDKMRVAFFLGAGCPVSIRVAVGQDTQPLIPDILGLTAKVCHELQISDKYTDSFGTILKRLASDGSAAPNIEEILSHIRSLHDVVGVGKIDGISKVILSELDENICKVVTDVVNVQLPSDDTPYHDLATWIGGIPRAHPVEIFTSNYDLLMEQALEDRRVPYFDGFVGSYRTFFDIASMEQGNLPARWARLWKVHGSYNWWRTSSGEVERRIEGGEGDRQMIYPSHLKYDQSRRMPYLAMIDRLRAFLTNGQAVLVTVGYSFSDPHLNDVILQGLSSNPTAICFGLLFGDRAKSPDAVAGARKQPNLSLLAADGAILGTTERDWRTNEKLEHPQHALAVQAGEMKNCKFLLGDFKFLGRFLTRQLAQREDKGNDDA